MPNRLEAIDTASRQDLARKLGLDDIDFHLQAKFHVGTERLEAFELLLRGKEGGSFVPPWSIVDRVRDAGIEMDFATTMTNRAVQIARTLHAESVRVPVAINIDEPDSRIPGLFEAMAAIIMGHNAEDHIEIELTERDRHPDLEHVRERLRCFTDRGIRLWLDDTIIGGAQAALCCDKVRAKEDCARLHCLPLHGMKIDRSVLGEPGEEDMHKESAEAALRQSMHCASVHRVSQIVAEGVETEAHLAWCQDHGIRTVQGYLLHRPETLEAAVRTFSEKQGKTRREAMG